MREGETACGTALTTGAQVVIEDVLESPIFLGSDCLEVMLDARARAFLIRKTSSAAIKNAWSEAQTGN